MITNKVTTVGKVKQAGWAEVERLQKELAVMKEKDTCAYDEHHICKVQVIAGRIQGMVFILNMMK